MGGCSEGKVGPHVPPAPLPSNHCSNAAALEPGGNRLAASACMAFASALNLNGMKQPLRGPTSRRMVPLASNGLTDFIVFSPRNLSKSDGIFFMDYFLSKSNALCRLFGRLSGGQIFVASAECLVLATDKQIGAKLPLFTIMSYAYKQCCPTGTPLLPDSKLPHLRSTMA